MIVLDCEEDYAKENAGSRLEELEAYKTNTLPAMAHFEDHQKLEFVSRGKFSSKFSLCN